MHRNSLPAFVLLLVLLYAVGLGARMTAVPLWGAPEMRVMDGSGGDAPLLATPDAYYWLAGASGKGAAADLAPSRLLRMFSAATGMQPARAALLLPALLASTLGPLLAVLCRTLAFSSAGLCAGLLATLAPAYYCRTGLGYYDTDMLLLPLALVTALSLLFLLRDGGRSGFIAAVFLGAAIAWLQSWHRLLPVCNASLFFVALVLALWRTRGPKSWGLYRLALFAASLFFSWPGILLAGAGALVLLFAPDALRTRLADKRSAFAALALVLCGLALFSHLRTEGQAYLQRARTKVVSGEQGGAVRAPVYPPMTRTIAEAERISYAHLLLLLHPWAGVALAGLCGFAWLARIRPDALLLCPLLALGLSAPFLGARTALFAVPSVALGFAVGAEALLGRIPVFFSQKSVALAVRGLLALLVSLPLLVRLPSPEPALSAPHAAALLRLGEQVSADTRALVWTWWDYGYATSYFSGLRSFADPGRQGPEYVYFLSKVLGSESPDRAAGLMQYSAAYDFHPWEGLNRLGARGAQELVEGTFAGNSAGRHDVRQFVVLSLEGLRLLPVIADFARWNLRTGKPGGKHGLFQELEPPVTIDLQHGRVNAPRSGTRTEVGAVLRWDNGPDEFLFDRTNPLCLVALSDPQAYLLLDRTLYASNYLRLLLGDPRQVRQQFRLVIDAGPRVRVYELVSREKGGGQGQNRLK